MSDIEQTPNINLAVVGSRNCTDYEFVKSKIDAFIKEYGIPSKIVSGGAFGVDSLAEKYARDNEIELLIFKADWHRHGKSAGPKRNKQIVENSTHVLAFPSPLGKGTQITIDMAKKADLNVEIFETDL